MALFFPCAAWLHHGPTWANTKREGSTCVELFDDLAPRAKEGDQADTTTEVASAALIGAHRKDSATERAVRLAADIRSRLTNQRHARTLPLVRLGVDARTFGQDASKLRARGNPAPGKPSAAIKW